MHKHKDIQPHEVNMIMPRIIGKITPLLLCIRISYALLPISHIKIF
jgi:hypothetical protein